MFRWNATSAQMEPINAPGAIICLNSDMGPPRVDFVDLDGDGRLDMIRQETSSPGDPGIWVVRMNQNGLLGPAQSTGLGVTGCPGGGADLDGDGRGELLVGDGSCSQARAIRINDAGVLEAAAIPARAALSLELKRGDAPIVLGDLNGDGLSDALWFGQTAELRWNTGNGFGEVRVMPDAALQTLLSQVDVNERSVQTVDLNGDGREDLLVFVRASAQRSTSAFLSRGDGSFTKLELGIDPREMAKLGDFNGDGLTDILLAGASLSDSYSLERLIQKPDEIDVIEEVNDELPSGSPRVHVEYGRELSGDPASPDCAFPQRCMRRGMMVVRSLWGMDVQGTQTYSYEDPRFDRYGRGFLGFGTVRVWMPERPVETILSYDHTTRWGSSYPYANRPQKITQITPILTSGSGQPVSARARVAETTNTYAVRSLASYGAPSFFVYPSSWITKEWEEESVQIDWTNGHITGISGPGETPLRQRFGSTIYDDFGNVTHEVSETVGGDRREVTRVFDYGHTGEWLIGQMLSEDVAMGPATSPMPTPRHTEFVHDARGFVEQILVEPNHLDPDVRETITRVIDVDGLLLSETRTTPSEALPRAALDLVNPATALQGWGEQIVRHAGDEDYGALGEDAVDIAVAGLAVAGAAEAVAGEVVAGEAAAEAAGGEAAAESELLTQARGARDAVASELGPKRPPTRPAAVSGGYNTDTGKVAAGCSGGGLCAEDRVVQALGGDPNKVKFVEAVRPRPTGPPFEQVPVCARCEARYGRGAFSSGVEFKSDK